MDFQQACTFLQKFATGNYTPQEHQEFIDWLNTASEQDVQTIAEEYRVVAESKPPATNVHAALAERIEAAIDEHELAKQPDHDEAGAVVVPLKRPVRRLFVAAAMILLLLSTGILYYLRSNRNNASGDNKTPALVLHDALPGSNKATLLLSNGQTIVLDSAANGTIARQQHAVVNKQGEQIIYNANSGHTAVDPALSIAYNTVSTPRGGQYHIVLPDGSQVWLNAASSIHFPTAFTGATRNVEVSGEAYFEVAKNAAMPFVVKKKESDVEVQVLGTHFNFNAYDDEGKTKVTLVEGSVKVQSAIGNRESAILKPGEQAIVSNQANGSFTIDVDKDADVEEALAWKNGMFRFNNTNIAAIMKQVTRWYDVDIVYEGDVMNEFFSGTIPRNTKASGLFSVLELTQTVQFTINNKKVIVKPYKKA